MYWRVFARATLPTLIALERALRGNMRFPVCSPGLNGCAVSWRSDEDAVADVGAVERPRKVNTLAGGVGEVAGGLEIVG